MEGNDSVYQTFLVVEVREIRKKDFTSIIFAADRVDGKGAGKQKIVPKGKLKKCLPKAGLRKMQGSIISPWM